MYLIFFAIAVELIMLGSGRHMDYIKILPNSTQNMTEILDFIAHIFYACQLFVCRLSGLAFYRRVSERHHKLLVAINCGTAFMTAAFLPQIFLIIFHCKPVTALWPYEWQPEFPNYTCMAWGNVYATNSALSLGCDIVVFAIPIAIIVVLKSSWQKKMKLSFVLLPGVAYVAPTPCSVPA